MYGVLDKVFVEVTEELGKDKDLVARFKQMTLEKVESLLPETAGKTAERVCERAKDEASYNSSDLSKEVTKRITAYFQTPEGTTRLDAAIAKAIDVTLDGDAVSNRSSITTSGSASAFSRVTPSFRPSNPKRGRPIAKPRRLRRLHPLQRRFFPWNSASSVSRFPVIPLLGAQGIRGMVARTAGTTSSHRMLLQ